MTHRTHTHDTPRDDTGAADTADAAVARRQRFGRLPERIRLQDTVETKPATRPDPARDTYHADEWLIRYCG
ncbi:MULTISPECIES: hypothetical protein [Streptomyces]|uniref:Uncharacterized protein n=2 Tax=Streptomyces TaxID=1883 RepID=A0ABW6YS07_9ACTN|nr:MULTISPECIES: hypothetical protein [Streptomyces]MCL3997079.1 hypothetical protein [Streptomyces lavenduligriseus]QIS74402.1 hypothetical protein HB370_34115 [Streptomyces sp. DSM 40868]WDM15139.1 hypothetical protein J3S85_28670 [Streptomyces lavenduligriseus]